MSPTRRTTRIRNLPSSGDGSSLTSLLAWLVLFVFLIAIALVSWIGSFYIFGHPEEAFSYRVLKALKKIEEPKRFEPTNAPTGEFLTPQNVLDRYSNLQPRQLRETNKILLRNYIRNFQGAKGSVPYLIGDYTILDSYELTGADFISSGVVVLAQSKDDPRLLVEHLFSADKKNIPALHRTLLTGLDLKLQRRLDFSAIIHVHPLRDGRLKVTAIPITYGSYASTQGPGVFSLSPPAELNIDAGLPLLREARLEEATKKYLAYRRRSGLDMPGSEVSRASAANTLLRVQRPTAVDASDTMPLAPATNPVAAAAPTIPTTTTPVVPAPSPVTTPLRVRPALPVESPAPSLALGESISSPKPEPTPRPTPTSLAFASPSPLPLVTLSPSPAPAIANTAGRKWQLYEAGKMPRGRLVGVREIPQVAEKGLAGERMYLQGSFIVTASGKDRAVLRSRQPSILGSNARNVRVIVDFPEGVSPPAEGTSFSRDASRPFQITDISFADDGQINVRVREITKP